MALNPPGAHAQLITNAGATGSSGSVLAPSGSRTYHATAVASTGTGNLTVQVQGSMAGTLWDTIGTITLSSATTAGMSDGFTSGDRYFFLRGTVTVCSSNVTGNLAMGY